MSKRIKLPVSQVRVFDLLASQRDFELTIRQDCCLLDVRFYMRYPVPVYILHKYV